jgi:hypothetical protein
MMLVATWLYSPFETLAQSDSTLIKGELTWIRSVPYKYNRKPGEKNNGFLDPEYASIVKKGRRIIPALITQLTDTTKTRIVDQCTGQYYSIGELSYILIDNIESIPFALVTGVMADVLGSCSYLAIGELDYVRTNGAKFQSQYKSYFYSQKQKKK